MAIIREVIPVFILVVVYYALWDIDNTTRERKRRAVRRFRRGKEEIGYKRGGVERLSISKR